MMSAKVPNPVGRYVAMLLLEFWMQLLAPATPHVRFG